MFTKSFQENKKFIQEYAQHIYIISGGFSEYILPVVQGFGIDDAHVLANNFLFDTQGFVTGINKKNFLSQDLGKVKAVENLQLPGNVIVVGDGITDYQIRERGAATQFLAFTENIFRRSVTQQADAVISNFSEVLKYVDTASVQKHVKKRALLLENIDVLAKETFEEAGYSVELLSRALSESELIERISDVEILGIRSKTKITKNVLKHAKRLKVVGAYCIGLDQIDLDACQTREVSIFNAPYSSTRSVVELALGEIIILARGVIAKNSLLHTGVWQKSASGSFEIRGKTLGIIGYGNIGSQLGILAELLDMNVCFYDVEDKNPFGDAVRCKTLDALLKGSDIVTLHVDGRKENRHLIGTREFDIMRNGVIFLNLSRGFVVDIPSLARALKSGKVKGAAVDVFPEEPKSNTDLFISELQVLPNVILTPHVAGSTQEAQKAIAQFVTGKILENMVYKQEAKNISFTMKNIYFTVGPSQLYPTVSKHMREALLQDIPSRSHRGKWFGELFDTTLTSLKTLLSIPKAYHVFFVGSGTEAMERIIENCVDKKSTHFITGSFGKRFAEISRDLGKQAKEVEVSLDDALDLIPKVSTDAELLCFTHNDTSTGVALPMKHIYEIKKKYPKKLIALDTVSSFPYIDINYKYIDCTFFSVQKGFGLPAGLGVIVVSPQAIAAAQKLKIAGFHSFFEFLDYAKKSQTPETPNVLNIFLLNCVLVDMLKIGIKNIRRGTDEKAKLLYDFFDHSDIFQPFVKSKVFRSRTTLIINVKDSRKLVEKLKKKGVIFGSGYGTHKNDQIRIANFPAHSLANIKLLMGELRKY